MDPTTSSLIAQVEMAEEPELGIRRTPSGTHALGKVEYEIKDGEVVYGKGGTVGVMLTESEVGTSEPTLRELSEGLIAVYGTDYGSTVPRSSPGSPTRLGRPRPTATAGSCWPATPRTCTPRSVDRASTPACRTR